MNTDTERKPIKFGVRVSRIEPLALQPRFQIEMLEDMGEPDESGRHLYLTREQMAELHENTRVVLGSDVGAVKTVVVEA